MLLPDLEICKKEKCSKQNIYKDTVRAPRITYSMLNVKIIIQRKLGTTEDRLKHPFRERRPICLPPILLVLGYSKQYSRDGFLNVPAS